MITSPLAIAVVLADIESADGFTTKAYSRVYVYARARCKTLVF